MKAIFGLANAVAVLLDLEDILDIKPLPPELYPYSLIIGGK
jgi:hypothetical protein